MKSVDRYLDLVQEDLNEGKIWDATKKLWKDHKGKILGGAGAIAAGAAAYAGKKAYDKKQPNKVRQDAITKTGAGTRYSAKQVADQKQSTSKKATAAARKALIKKNIKFANFKDRKNAESDAMKKSVDQGAKKEIYNKYHPTSMAKKVGRFFRNAKQARQRMASNKKT